ncbi:GIY-YIG nuclease family protein [Acuticoccus sp. M5D2P5]|uniref:GIY-YIG nuclease family protein n=1 Tax=Acuticoccus kalidii TaxID=2910977 RepID=UPI001F27FED4|nr:GIY-YIG nuclease family protein [Acuticoccus kalidii]MCF3936173.1 GIY-YIG nuclease family protein [Acuticoccus kalidii]
MTIFDRIETMIFGFTDLLCKAGIEPEHVRLLRHQTKTPMGRTPYLLWRDQRGAFEEYQSVQTVGVRARLASPIWASFVVPPAGGTLFAGLYSAERIGPADPDWIDPLYGRPGAELTQDGLDLYQTRPMTALESYVGRLSIEWGKGARSWVQRADMQVKAIVELTKVFREDAFPGYTHFVTNVSEIQGLPLTWASALRVARGVYLLTSAKTREQHVGSATGEGGFFGRWANYAQDGHGGNLGLKSSEPSDYQISILEVAGSAATVEEIIAIEQLWKRKLQSREMGLNRN